MTTMNKDYAGCDWTEVNTLTGLQQYHHLIGLEKEGWYVDGVHTYLLLDVGNGRYRLIRWTYHGDLREELKRLLELPIQKII